MAKAKTQGEESVDSADKALSPHDPATAFNPVMSVDAENDDPDPPEPTPSFADKLYEEITSVIGASNPNQFFCMGLPGTLIDASQYTYDIENNEPKPPHVEANESKLVNKLFDACQMSASDNGRHLSSQYKTALDILTPKLNGKLFEAKTKLREVLMTPYPYNFGDGSKDLLTLEQVFYRLYGDYVAAKQAWVQKQLEKKRELAERYPDNTAEAYRRRDDDYLDWYQTAAESEALVVEEKLGKVLGVFSPGDMEIITGILDSGAGREIAEARATLANVGKMNPDGGTVYPVTLYPENWFTLLDTSFTPVDLLESPAALAQQLSILVAQRSNLTANINAFLAIIPNEEEVIALKNAYDSSNSAFNTALLEAQKTYTTTTVDMLKTLVDVMTSSGQKKPEDVEPATAAKIFGVDVETAGKLLSSLGETLTSCLSAQSDLIAKAQKATDAAAEYFTKKNQLQYKSMLTPLKQQLEEINEKIAAQQEKIRLSTVIAHKEADNTSVAPNHVPENFTQILITSSMKEANQASSSQTSASASSYGVSFFFGGYSSSSSHQSAVSDAFEQSKDMSIEIGMSVAKVQIGREWFNPGVFMLTADMYNTASQPIAPSKDYTEFTPERFSDMNKSLFPCFPTAFVIARDVTIRFSTSTAMSSAFASSVEDHSVNGGGFFIFSGSRSSSSGSSKSNSSAKSTAKSVTVRFANPQILGYYLEATPTDRSESISSEQSHSSKDFISIFEFITAFQRMLDDYRKNHAVATA